MTGALPHPGWRARTRIPGKSNDLAVLSARTVDWPESMEPLIVALPATVYRLGSVDGGQPASLRGSLR